MTNQAAAEKTQALIDYQAHLTQAATARAHYQGCCKNMNPHVVNDLAISNSAVIVGCGDGKSLEPYYLWTDYLNVYYQHLIALNTNRISQLYYQRSKPGKPV